MKREYKVVTKKWLHLYHPSTKSWFLEDGSVKRCHGRLPMQCYVKITIANNNYSYRLVKLQNCSSKNVSNYCDKNCCAR